MTVPPVGRLPILGFRGTAAPDWLLQALRGSLVGGVILFDRDVLRPDAERNVRDGEQVAGLIRELRAAAAPARLLVCVDQEGGRVARLGPAHGFPALPSAAELGRGDPAGTRAAGAACGGLLAGLGIDCALAPVADLDRGCPVIGGLDRAFAADPTAVATHCAAFAAGLRTRGVLAVAKHFPGHGSAGGDTHRGLVDITDTWREDELVPFAELIAGGAIDGVMTAHLLHRGLDPELPATLSPAIVERILRRRLGFTGPVFSDDLDMAALAERWPLAERLRLLIAAGVDLPLVGNNLAHDEAVAETIHAGLVRLAEAGSEWRARLRAAIRRRETLSARSK